MLASQYEKITTPNVIGMIVEGLDTGPSAWVLALAMKTESNNAGEDYGWLGNAPALREFIDGRSPAELRENSFRINNKDYEGSIKVKPKDLRRDKTGQLRIRINQLTERANDNPAKLLSTLILNGASTNCYDGQYYFDTDHSEGNSGSQSNSITYDSVSTTAPTSDEFGEAILAAIVKLLGYVDDRGEPMNQSAREFVVMVPPPFAGVALKAVTALLGSGGASATIPALKGKFTVSVEVNPRLTWTTKFVLFRTDQAAKAFVLQEEVAATPVALGEESEYAIEHGECLFGVDWAGNVGYGFWQFAVLVTFV